MYSRAEINGDSNYVVYAAWPVAAAAAAGLDPLWRCFRTRRAAHRGTTGRSGLPNVERVPYRVVPRKRGNAVAWDAAWVADLFRSSLLDVVCWPSAEEAGHRLAAAPAGWRAATPLRRPRLHPVPVREHGQPRGGAGDRGVPGGPARLQ